MSDDLGTIRVVPGGLDALAHTPELAAGDLLLLRGDVAHRTQDTSTARIALSVRATNGAAVVRRSRLASGGVRKALMMARNPQPYSMAFQAFDAAGTDELSVRELAARLATMVPPPPARRREFLGHLVAEKRRARGPTRFALDVPMAAGLRGVTTVQRRIDQRRLPVSS